MNYRGFCTFFLLLAGMLAGRPAAAQTLTTEGREFWLGYLDNWLQDPNNPIILELYISADDTTAGTVTIPMAGGSPLTPFTVIPGVTTVLTIPANVAMAVGSGQIQNRGVHVATDKDVSVYAMNKRQYSADMAMVLPINSLGSDYYVMSHWEDGNRENNQHSDSEFLVVAVSDATQIEITPSVFTASGQQPGVPYVVTLNQDQVYQLQARGDLSGSRIRSINAVEGVCNNFAVFGGNRYTKVGQCNHPDGHDHLFDQMYPVDTWGKEYITVPFASRSGGDLIKILAAEDDTEVTVNGSSVSLDGGQFTSFIEREVTVVKSNKPVSVGQFSLSQGCDNNIGDPFLVMISPNEQLMKKITFNAPAIATISNYEVTIVAPTASAALVQFGGASIANSFEPVPLSPGYSYATLRTSGGNHTITSDGKGFIAYVYGYGNNESFGYPTGAALGNLKIDFAFLNSEGELLLKDSLCPASTVYFQPISEYEFQEYSWDFGDGSVTTNGQNEPVTHIYEGPGVYIIRLIASTGTGECGSGNQEISLKEVRVEYPHVEILGPRSVCPNTENAVYKVDNPANHSLTWNVEGGQIRSVYNDSIAIDWGPTNAAAKVRVLATSRFGCSGAENQLPVKINIQLEPEAPFGIDSVCVSDAKQLIYQTYFTEGSVYNWLSSNGVVMDGQGKNSIKLDWLEAGAGALWFEQLTTTDTICSGFSDSLFVFVQREPATDAEIYSSRALPYIQDELTFTANADTLFTLVDWDFGDGTTRDSVAIWESVSHVYQCQGVFTVRAVAYDTTLFCHTKAEAIRQQTVLPPPVEIIRVTHSESEVNSLQIDWIGSGEEWQFTKELDLYRRSNFPEATSWQTVANLADGITSFVDRNGLKTATHGYAYQLVGNLDCESAIITSLHESMMLSGEADLDATKATVAWNSYEGWKNGVSHYEIWLTVDEGEQVLLENTTSTNYEFPYREDGFSYCFRVRAVENEGNQTWSFSNEACVAFVPEVHVYNVFTPNNDGLNEYFTITGVELFKSSLLVVVDRMGHEVFREVGYKNDWKGEENGNNLPSGVYYYVLELNEPRAPTTRINGMVSIMR